MKFSLMALAVIRKTLFINTGLICKWQECVVMKELMILTRCLYSDVSRSSDVSISIYLRPSPETKDSISNNHSATTKHADYFLGGVKLQPNFDSTRLDDQVLQIVGGTGMMHVQLCYKRQQVG
jgi:hypothetical protein